MQYPCLLVLFILDRFLNDTDYIPLNLRKSMDDNSEKILCEEAFVACIRYYPSIRLERLT
jgi:hypothetical protein